MSRWMGGSRIIRNLGDRFCRKGPNASPCVRLNYACKASVVHLAVLKQENKKTLLYEFCKFKTPFERKDQITQRRQACHLQSHQIIEP